MLMCLHVTKVFVFILLQLNSLHYAGNDLGENSGSKFRMESGEIGIQPVGTFTIIKKCYLNF